MPSRTPHARVAVNSQTTPHATLHEFLVESSAAGFAEVELAGELLEHDPATAIPMVRDSALGIVGLAPTRLLHEWHWRWDGETESRLALELARARAIGAGYLVLPFMSERGDAASVSAHLARAEPIAAAAGVRLAVEPIGHHDVLRRADELVAVVGERNPTVVGVLLDSFHFFRAGNVIEDLALFAEVTVLALQVSNANDVARDRLLGYRDRTFPLDGPFPVEPMVRWWIETHPNRPLIVEVIGDLVRSQTTQESLALAHEHASRLVAIPGSTESVHREEPHHD